MGYLEEEVVFDPNELPDVFFGRPDRGPDNPQEQENAEGSDTDLNQSSGEDNDVSAHPPGEDGDISNHPTEEDDDPDNPNDRDYPDDPDNPDDPPQEDNDGEREAGMINVYYEKDQLFSLGTVISLKPFSIYK